MALVQKTQPDAQEIHRQRTQEILDEKFMQGKIKNLYISEVMEGISESKTFEDRVLTLRNNSDRSLNTILLYMFKNDRPRLTSEDVESVVFKCVHPGDDISMAPMNLYSVAKRLYVFWRTDLSIDSLKKVVFEILSSLHEDEVPIFKSIFSGESNYPGIDKELVNEAFPSLFAREVEVQETKPKSARPTEDTKQISDMLKEIARLKLELESVDEETKEAKYLTDSPLEDELEKKTPVKPVAKKPVKPAVKKSTAKTKNEETK